MNATQPKNKILGGFHPPPCEVLVWFCIWVLWFSSVNQHCVAMPEG